MRRRAYLGAVASSVGIVAGCAGGDEGTETVAESPTATPTVATATETTTASPMQSDTPTDVAEDSPTETESTSPEPPYITRANLVWSDQGSDFVREKKVASVAPGPGVTLGVEAVLSVDAGTVSTWVACGVEDSDGSFLTGIQWPVEREVSDTGSAMVETSGTLNLAEEPTGRYEMTLWLADSQDGDPTSEVGRFWFELVEPLEPDEIRLLDYSPKEVRAGERFESTLELQNLTDRTSSIVSPFESSKLGSSLSDQLAEVAQLTVPAGPPVMIQMPELKMSEPGTYEVGFPAADLSWTVTVTDPGM